MSVFISPGLMLSNSFATISSFSPPFVNRKVWDNFDAKSCHLTKIEKSTLDENSISAHLTYSSVILSGPDWTNSQGPNVINRF